MAIRTVSRDIQVKVCDECGLENSCLDRCGLCRKDKCDSHMAYALDDLFRYSDRARVGGYGRHICQHCTTTQTGTIGQLLDVMLDQYK